MLDSYFSKNIYYKKKKRRKKTENILIETEKTKYKKKKMYFFILFTAIPFFAYSFQSLFSFLFKNTHLPFISIFQASFSHY